MTHYAKPTRKGVALIERARSQADTLNKTLADLNGHYRHDDRATVVADASGRIVDEVQRIANQLDIMQIEDSGLLTGVGKP